LVLKNLKPEILKQTTLITFQDRPKGRGLKAGPNPAKKQAEKLGLKIKEIKDKNDIFKILTHSNYDLAIVAGFSLILPKEVLISPKTKLKSIGLHPSLLPLLRGPSPIQTAILQDKKITGVSLFQLAEKIDAGKILVQDKLKIRETDTFLDLEKRLAQLGVKILNSNLKLYLQNKLKSHSQKGKISKTYLFQKQDGKIKKQDTPEQIWLKFRAFYPWPGIYFETKGKRVKITDLEFKQGKIIIKKVIPEGKREMKFREFLAGYSLPLELRDKIIYS